MNPIQPNFTKENILSGLPKLAADHAVDYETIPSHERTSILSYAGTSLGGAEAIRSFPKEHCLFLANDKIKSSLERGWLHSATEIAKNMVKAGFTEFQETLEQLTELLYQGAIKDDQYRWLSSFSQYTSKELAAQYDTVSPLIKIYDNLIARCEYDKAYRTAIDCCTRSIPGSEKLLMESVLLAMVINTDKDDGTKNLRRGQLSKTEEYNDEAMLREHVLVKMHIVQEENLDGLLPHLQVGQRETLIKTMMDGFRKAMSINNFDLLAADSSKKSHILIDLANALNSITPNSRLGNLMLQLKLKDADNEILRRNLEDASPEERKQISKQRELYNGIHSLISRFIQAQSRVAAGFNPALERQLGQR